MSCLSIKFGTKVFLAILMIVLGGTVGGNTASADTLTNVSPTPGNFIYEGNNSGYSPSNDMAKHLLIATAHGVVPTIKLGMYLNTGGQKEVKIVDSALGDGGICRTNGSGARPLSSDFIRVRIWEPGNVSNEIIYNIRGSDVCNGQAANNLPRTANPKFFGTYQTPAPTRKDPDTDYYRLNISISFIDRGSLPATPGNDQAVSFKVISPFQSKIGNIDTSESTQRDPNNSTLAKEVGNPGGVTHRFGFALPCRITKPSDQQVTLYDADNGLQNGGDVKFYIVGISPDGTRSPLRASQYGERFQVTRDDIGSIVAFRPWDGSEMTYRVTIKDMDPAFKYVLVVKNVRGAGRPDSSNPLAASNFIYVGLPGDSIFGDEEFTCPGWEATPNTLVNAESVPVGRTIRWTHTVQNKGDDTTQPIGWEIIQTGINPSTVSGTIPANQNDQLLSEVKTYQAKRSDVGKEICQQIRIKPNALRSGDLDTDWEASDKKCVKIVAPRTGNFDPEVTLDPEIVEPNQTYTEDSSVTGGTIPYASELSRPKPEVKYQLGRVVYLPGSTVFNQSGSNTSPTCAFYGQPRSEYCAPSFRQGTVDERNGIPYGTPNLLYTEVFPDELPSGTRICYIMAVEQPPTVDTHTYRQRERIGTDRRGRPIYRWVTHTDRYYSDQGHRHAGDTIAAIPRQWKYDTGCVVVGKRPKVHIQGNDLRVRGNTETKVTKYNGSYYGSWVEYGAFTTKRDNAPASGAGYRNGSTSDLNSRSLWSRLTFANTVENRPNAYGYFTSLPLAPSVAAYYYQQTDGASGWGGGALPGGLRRAGSVSVSGSNDNLSEDRSTVIYSTGTVTINSNISYRDGGYASFDHIPQVIIVAQNINITSNVNRIDAWLIAYGNKSDKTKGNINTCSDGPDTSHRTSAPPCNNPLTVNGAVIANGLYLNRTGPAGSDPTAAAEIFRLRPDAYLWAAARQKSTGAARTVDIVELPPRF